MSASDDTYLSPRQVAEQVLGDRRRERSVRHWYESHGLPVHRIGQSVLIRVGDLREWLEARRTAEVA